LIALNSLFSILSQAGTHLYRIGCRYAHRKKAGNLEAVSEIKKQKYVDH
jgi:hypothetical protein